MSIERLPLYVLSAIIIAANIVIFRVGIPWLVNLHNDAALFLAFALALAVLSFDAIFIHELFIKGDTPHEG